MWIAKFVSSSIGKKYVMAFTGLLLILFLLLHAIGNAAIFYSSKAFQMYADTLHSLPVVVSLFGIGLLIVFSAHVYFGVTLFFQNRRNSSSRYAVSAKVSNNTFASSTMPYTGILILLFIIVHVFGFGFVPADIQISELVKERLSSFFYGLFYIFSFCALSVHLSHGFWSMLQTFGVNHPRYNRLIAQTTLVLPGLFLIFFGSIAVYFMTGTGANY